MVRPIIPLLLILGALVACRQEKPPSAASPTSLPVPSSRPALPDGFQEAARAAKVEEDRDRRLMITAAPAGFMPASPEPKLRITIVAESARIRVRSPLRLKLIVQNVGGQAYSYTEKGSLLKAAGVIDGSWSFYSLQRGGSWKKIPPPIGGGDGDEEGEFMPAEEAERRGRVAAEFSVLHAKIAPGESLVSLPRRPFDSEPHRPAEVDRLVEVADKFTFTEPGRLRIRAEHTSAGFDPVKVEILPEETSVSNEIEVEVVP
jgi:hypothetical protein